MNIRNCFDYFEIFVLVLAKCFAAYLKYGMARVALAALVWKLFYFVIYEILVSVKVF